MFSCRRQPQSPWSVDASRVPLLGERIRDPWSCKIRIKQSGRAIVTVSHLSSVAEIQTNIHRRRRSRTSVPLGRGRTWYFKRSHSVLADETRLGYKASMSRLHIDMLHFPHTLGKSRGPCEASLRASPFSHGHSVRFTFLESLKACTRDENTRW